MIDAALFGVVIYIVGKLGLGMEVSGFGGAIIAAIAMSVVAWLFSWVVGLFL